MFCPPLPPHPQEGRLAPPAGMRAPQVKEPFV